MFLRQGRWCSTCYRESVRFSLEEVQQLVKEKYQGLCLSESYESSNQQLTWQCKQGHVWQGTYDNVQRGNWCSVCNKQARQKKRLAEMQAHAKARGGECLSTEYINSSTKLTWRCDQGHEWKTKATSITYSNTWCPVCRYDKKRLTLADMQVLAAKKGGRCLSDTYVSSNHHMDWACAKGHVWRTTPSHIYTGTWCGECYIDSLRSSLDDMQTLARERGGECLSTTYVNTSVKLRWQCHRGHIWDATPGHVKDGTWCPECYYLSISLKRSKRRKYLPAKDKE